jgi:L-fuconolactonase
MLIVDSQVHAWSQGESTGPHRRSPITRDILTAEMAGAGVARVVLAPPLWDPGGNEYSLSLAHAEPDRFAVMGLIEPDVADPCQRLRTWQEQRGMLGVRLLFNSKHRIAPLQDGRLAPLWAVAEEMDLAVALLIPGALHLVDDIARSHPGLKIIVDHLGVPRGFSGPAAFDHLPALLALAAHPNVCVKASGMGDYALDPYPFRSLDMALRRVFDSFGPERILWGSDLSRLHHPYRQCVSHFSESLSWLSRGDLELIMGGNICRLLRWKL